MVDRDTPTSYNNQVISANFTWPEIGDISGSTLRNLTRILIRILIPLLRELLVLLTFIELLTNHGSGTGVQGIATAAKITKGEKNDTEFANSDFL